jgi:hypothetical protein
VGVVLSWLLLVVAAVLALALVLGVLSWLVRLIGLEKRAYFAALVVAAVALPGIGGFMASGLYLLHAKLKLPINHDGPNSFLYGSAIAIGVWLVAALLFQRYGRVEQANPTEYRRLRAYHDALRTRYRALSDADRDLVAARLAKTELDGARTALRIDGDDELTRGIAWASQGGYVVVRARLDAAERALLEFEADDDLPALTTDLRAQIDGSRIPGSAALVETLRDVSADLDKPNPNIKRARAYLRHVRKALDSYRDGRRYGLVSARSGLYGPIVLGGLFAYFALGLALILGAGARQIGTGVAFYLVGIVIGVIRHLVAASAADTQVEEDYGLDDARLLQRPLFSGAAAVGGVFLMTMLAALAPLGTPDGGSGGSSTQATEQQTERELPTLEQIFDWDGNRLGFVYAAIFGLTPALLARRLGEAAETFKVDLRSTQPAEQSGSG